MAKKHMKRCLTSLILREMEIRITMWYHLTSARVAIIKKSANGMYILERVWRKGNPLRCRWGCRYDHSGKRPELPESTANRTAVRCGNPSAGHTVGENHNVKTHGLSSIRRSTPRNDQDRKRPKRPSGRTVAEGEGHRHNGLSLSRAKDAAMPFATTRSDLEVVLLLWLKRRGRRPTSCGIACVWD